MPLLKRLFSPLRKGLVAFFSHHVSLKPADRGGKGLKLVLEERKPGKTGPKRLTREDIKAQKERELVEQMLGELDGLFNEHPGSRKTLRHLASLQKAVRKEGLPVINRVPIELLQRSLNQLEGMVTNWSPVGLATLRSKIAVAIIDREHQDALAAADEYKTSALMDSGLSSTLGLPDVDTRPSDDALAAAYAALGAPSRPAAVELQGELGSRSAKVVAKAPRPRPEAAQPIQIKVLSD